MERKLLSLPSFFVLLLIAGIAFLAVPVADVSATPPVLDSSNPVVVLARAGTPPVVPTATTAVTATGVIELVVVKFDQPVKVNGVASATAVTGFGKEDVRISVTDTSTGAAFPSYNLPLSAITVTPLPQSIAVSNMPKTGAPAANQWFVVSGDVPDNGTGTLTVRVKTAGTTTATSSFENAGAEDYAGVGDLPATSPAVHYNTYNSLPTVAITAPETAGLAPFEVTFKITDTIKFATAPTLAPASIDIVGGSVTDVNTATVTTKTPTGSEYEVIALIQAASTSTSVVIGVKADVVTDAGGAKNVAISATKTGTAPNLKLPAGAKEVMIDLVEPEVVIDVPKNADGTVKTQPVSVAFTVDFSVTKDVTTGSGATAKTTTMTLNRADLVPATAADAVPDDLDVPSTGDKDVTVTGGTLSGFGPKSGSFKKWTAMVTPSATAENVVITVIENAVKTSAGNGNEAHSVTVPTDYTPTPPVVPDPEYGTLTTNGFSVPLNVPANSFVVLARSVKVADNGISGLKSGDPALADTKIVDIKDDVWQDLSSFMGVGPGGAIDLLVATGTATDEDLVISEIMWGSDAGLGTGATIAARANSQWIELYNTKSTAITGTWELMFTKSGTGEGVTNARLSDKFTNFGLTQSNQFWAISDTDGGTYGQGGRTSSSGSNIGTIRRLVSMERKIDFVKVEKTNHDTNDATKNRNTQLEGVPAGDLAGSWQASKDPQGANLSGRRLGTPGAKPFVTVSTTSISKSVVFNEIANRSDDKDDWIELYNPGGSDVQINNWVITKVTKVGTDEVLFKFESDENIVVPSKGFLLVVNEDPSETSLSAGENVDNPGSKANGLPTKFYLNDKLKIPEKDYLFILRTEDKKGTDEKIVDIAGNIGAMNLSDAGFRTDLWPLKAWNAIKTDDLAQNNDKTWVRDKGKNLNHGDAWKPDGGVTGLGVDRAATSRHSGTPGFDNGAVKGKVKDLADKSNPVVISEIMFGSGNGRVPQWIELYNPSMTQAVNLDGWRLEVQNISDASEDLNVKFNYELKLPAKRIQPNQTILIVSASGDTNDDKRFPNDRIINVWSTRTLRTAAEMSGRRDALLSSIGFYLTLSDPDKVMVDEIGNIEGNKRNNRPPEWPLKGGNLEDGGRASMVRVGGTEGDGTEPDAWRPAQNTVGGEVGVETLYYGDEDDYGTPGYTPGGPLPVQLSSFYSKRNDAGAVVITWSTESELDNAGFNILRSVSRTGEFTRINAQLIPGAGTTGEKNTYTWTDTSARPNVVYYYQIEDVSLEGEHRTLRTTRLRGHVGAAGKATVIWGELKSRE